jgi:hypothetical protein
MILTAVTLASCTDWLDISPSDKTREEDLFSTLTGVQSANNGLYREFIQGQLYGRFLTQTVVDVMGHAITYSPASSLPGLSTGNIQQNWALGRWEYTDDNAKTVFQSIWESGYATVLHLNAYIKNLEASPAVMSDAERNLLLGEAYGLRAYLHFDLFRLYGPIWENRTAEKIMPYNTKNSVTINHIGYEQTVYSTADEFMALVKADIATAQKLLAQDPIISDAKSITNDLSSESFFSNRNRRMNYYAAKGLEARVLQYCGDHVKAAAAAKVITDQIGDGKRFKWPAIATVVSNNNYIFFGEVIFGINNIDMTAQSTSLYESPQFKNSYLVDAANLMQNIFGDYNVNTFAEIDDIRAKQWTVSPVTDNSGITFSQNGTYVSNKYRRFSYRDYDGTANYFPAVKDLQVLMRVSEMFYIQAEAEFRAGRKAEAADLINQVLIRRNLTVQSLMTPEKSDDEFNKKFEREYYREFMGEGQVFFFHKRRASRSMFKGYSEGSETITGDLKNVYVVPLPETETNI